MTRFAWIIDDDRQARAELRKTGRCEDDARGRTGPPGAPPEMIYALTRGHTSSYEVCPFRLYDQRGTHYAGRMIADGRVTKEMAALVLEEFKARGMTGIVSPFRYDLGI